MRFFMLKAMSAFFVVTAIAIALPARAQTTTRTCADGSTSHPATALEAASVSSGIVAGVTQLCPEDAKLGINMTSGQAKEYLYSISTKVNTADKDHIEKLDNAFAVCAANFFKAFTAKYNIPLKITSAWRSAEDQRRVSTSPTSNHTRGLAMDVHPSPDTQQNYDLLQGFTIANKQFGVCFPRPPYNGSPDLPHIILAGIGGGSEAPRCDRMGITRPCEAGKFDPTKVVDAGPAAPSSAGPAAPQTPMQSMMSGLQSLFAPPPVQQCPLGYLLLNGQCMPQQAQATQQVTSPYSYAQPTGGTTGTAGTVTGTTIGTGVGGTSGNAVTGTNMGSGINISGLIDTPTSSKSGSTTSAIDLISALGNPTTTSSAATSGQAVALNGSLASQVALQGQSAQTVRLSPTSTYQLAPRVSETFVSQDLSQPPTNFTPQQQSSTFRLLESIKQVLLGILSMLKPFGGTLPNTAVSPATSMTAILK